MAITRATGFPVSSSPAGSTSETTSITPQNIGDLVVLAVSAAPSTVTLTGVSGGGVSSWRKVLDHAGGGYVALWMGIATATGAQTVTLTFSAAPAGNSIVVDSFTGMQGWRVEASGSIDNASSTTVTFPNVNATRNNELYWGMSGVANTGAAGASSGFTYNLDPNNNPYCFNPSVSKGAVQPTASQAPAGTSTAIAAVFSAGNVSRPIGAMQAVQSAATR